MSTLITASALVGPERILAPGWLAVDGERIVGLGEGEPARPADLDLGDLTIAPGYVDIHCHGGGGAAFTVGDPNQAATAAGAHLKHGTTSIVASLVTERVPMLEQYVDALSDLVADGLLAGLHLEGPWLCQTYHGAHQPDLLRAPDPADVDRLLRAGGDALKMITLAPELPGALDAVKAIHAAGVVPAVGHTEATYAQTVEAIGAGATVATHLFNAEKPIKHREPGPIPALLEARQVAPEVIADGIHLHPAVIQLIANAAAGRFVLVTDAMAAAAAEDGDYRLGPIHVQVRDGVARTAEGAIAGSTLTMAAAVRFATRHGIDRFDAIQAATARPAAALGLDAGVLKVGARADLIALTDDLDVAKVMRAGTWL